MPRFSSNDMVHNHYLEEAKNKAQDEGRNSKPSMMPSSRSQSTANGGNRRVGFSRQLVLGGFLLERYSPLAQPRYFQLKGRIHDHDNEPSSLKLVPKVVPPADKTATSQQLYSGGGIPFQLKSDSLPHAHAQTTKTYYKHQDSSIKKAQVLKTKASAYSDIKDNSSKIKLKGRLLASFQ
ncbi:hypothetical protein Tco_1345933 [Tanacetum coccineum]